MKTIEVKYSQWWRRFDFPEFYDNGLVAVVSIGDRSIEVRRDGEALMWFESRAYRNAEQFREAFFDNPALPTDEQGADWVFNGWFDLYDPEEDSWESLNEIDYSLRSSVHRAIELLQAEEK